MTKNVERARAHNRSDMIRTDRARCIDAEIEIGRKIIAGLYGRDKDIARGALVRALAHLILADSTLAVSRKIIIADLHGMHLRAFLLNQTKIVGA